MAQVMVNIPIDEEIKLQAEAYFAAFGLTLAAGFCSLLREKLEPPAHDFYDLKPEYQEAIADAAAGRNLIGPFDTAEEAVAAMLED